MNSLTVFPIFVELSDYVRDGRVSSTEVLIEKGKPSQPISSAVGGISEFEILCVLIQHNR